MKNTVLFSEISRYCFFAVWCALLPDEVADVYPDCATMKHQKNPALATSCPGGDNSQRNFVLRDIY